MRDHGLLLHKLEDARVVSRELSLVTIIYLGSFFCTSGIVACHSLVPMRMEIAGANMCWVAGLMMKTLALRLTIWSIVRVQHC